MCKGHFFKLVVYKTANVPFCRVAFPCKTKVFLLKCALQNNKFHIFSAFRQFQNTPYPFSTAKTHKQNKPQKTIVLFTQL